MRKLASVVRVSKVSPIEGADRLEVVEMAGKGWRVVVPKGQFAPDARGVYFEIDSFLPANDVRYAFLRDRCMKRFVTKGGEVLREGLRIKTVKLRGVLSQGLLLPASYFPQASDVLEGGDLTELLHVEHYDEVAEACRPAQGLSATAADAMGAFPSKWMPKTDEERIQNLGDWLEKMKGVRFEVTEKMDGTSITMFYSPSVDAENPFGVCSRNLRLKPQTADGAVPLAWRIAEKSGARKSIETWCIRNGRELAFQGELVGPGINKNRDKRTDYEWRVFRVWDIARQEFLQPNKARSLCGSPGLPYVPVVHDGLLVFNKFSTIDEILAYAEGKTERGNEREGLVFKSTDAPYASFKAVSNRYLLKGE